MSFFKLNIDDIEEKVSSFNSISKKLIDNKDLACESLINVNFCWDEALASTFISQVKINDQKLDDYMLYLDKVYKELLTLCDEVSIVCSSFNYKGVNTIKFNDNKIDTCLNYLDQCIELLNINLQRLKSVKNDIDLLSVSSINQKIEEINSVINMIKVLKNDISKFCDSINNCLDNSKNRKNGIEKFELDIALMDYKSIFKN